jgi:multidrug resistance efflux pump
MQETIVPTATLRERVQSLRLPERVDCGRGGRGGWLPWALCLLLAASTVSLAARVYTAPPPEPTQPAAVPNQQASAKADASGGSPASKSTSAPDNKPTVGAVVLESKGYIIPAHQIQVSPIEVGGRVLELFVEEGKRFKKGDVLAILEKTSYEAQVAESVASLEAAEQRYLELRRGFRKEEIEQAKAELNESQTQLKQSELEYKRNRDLRGPAISAREYETAEAQYQGMVKRVERLKLALALMDMGPREERIAAARAEVEQNKARLTQAKWRLENCTIRAPLDGTILTKKAELGNLVNPLAFGATSGSICEMADLSDLEVELDITERDVSKVRQGMPCRIRAEAYQDRSYEGFVDRLMPIANRAKGAVPVRVKVKVPKDEEGVYLKPEMGAVVAFLQSDK